MINLRYHIVSLTAVFLALGIGVLLGGTYLDKYTVDQLDESISNAETRIRETSAENDRLRGEIGDAEARDRSLLDAGTTQLFESKLTDVPVVVVAAEGTDETARRNLVRAITSSGADFRGTLTVTGGFEDMDDDKAAAAGEALDLTATTPSAVRAELIDQFGQALAAAGTAPEVPDPGATTTLPDATQPTAPDGSVATTSTPSTVPDATAPTTTLPTGAVDPNVTVPVQPEPEPPRQPDVVTVMLAEGLLSYEAPTQASSSGPLLTDRGYRYVFVSGAEPAVPDESFLVPVLRRMADAGPVPVVVAAPSPDGSEDDTVVTTTRGDAELSRLVSTVDNLETFSGVVSSILALDEIGRGARGHYGEGRGASAPLPTGA